MPLLLSCFLQSFGRIPALCTLPHPGMPTVDLSFAPQPLVYDRPAKRNIMNHFLISSGSLSILCLW